MKGGSQVKKIITVSKGFKLGNMEQHVGCGECQTSCQSACKTSCTVANQKCENPNRKKTDKQFVQTKIGKYDIIVYVSISDNRAKCEESPGTARHDAR